MTSRCPTRHRRRCCSSPRAAASPRDGDAALADGARPEPGHRAHPLRAVGRGGDLPRRIAGAGGSRAGLPAASAADRGQTASWTSTTSTNSVPDWRGRPTWACGPPAMLDAVEKVWAGRRARGRPAHGAVRHRPHRQGRRGRNGHLRDLGQDRRGRRRDLDCSRPARRSESRCRSAAGWASAKPACCRWNPGTSATSGPATSTARATASTPASPPHPATAPLNI